MNMHFEQYDVMSITDGTRKCPNITNTEKASKKTKRKLLAWKSNNAWMVVLVASVLSQPVADLVLMHSDDKDDKLVGMSKSVFND